MTIEYRKKSLILKIQAILGLIAPIIFTIVIIYYGSMWQDYNPWLMTISDLGANPSPFASIVSLTFILTGFSIILFGIGLHNTIKARIIPSTGMMIIIFGLSDLFISGLFPTDVKGIPLSFYGLIHSLGSFIGDIALLFAPFLLLKELPVNDEWKRLRTISLIVGILGLILFLLFVFLSLFFINFSGIPFGIIQRIIIGIYFVWFFFLAFNLLSLSRN